MPTTWEYRSVEEARDVLEGMTAHGDSASLFDSTEWFALLHRHCLGGSAPLIVAAKDGPASVWMFLIETGPGRVSAMANWYSFHWRPVFLGDPDEGQRMRLLDAVAKHLLDQFRLIDLYPMDAQHMLLASLRRAGWLAITRPMGGRYILDLAGRDFATWWAQRPGRLRSLVRRKGRSGRYAINIHDRLTDMLWDDYVAVDARSWKQPDQGLIFLRALAEAESRAGRLRLGFAREDGHPVATQLWSVDGDTALIHKLSHDAAHDGGSPGTLLSHAMFARTIDMEGVSRIDYGTGDNGYKADWMDRRVPLYQIDGFNPRCPSSWLPAARTAISALVG